MDSQTRTTHSPGTTDAPGGRPFWFLVAVLGLAVYGLLLARNVGAYAGGSDSSGYYHFARLLAAGTVHTPVRSVPELQAGRPSPWLFSPLGFRPAPGGGEALVPTYPAGLPLLLASAATVVGWNHAGDVVLWLHSMGCLVLVYAAGRAFGLSRRMSLVAAYLVASSPLFLFMSLSTMSDVPATAWVTAAVLMAWQSDRNARWALASGAAFAMAVLIRPTDTLAVVPIACALGAAPRRWILFLAGGIPGAVFFFAVTHAAFGTWFATGYGDSARLDSQWILPTLWHYGRWLPIVFTPVVAAFVGLPIVARQNRRAVAVLGSWVVVFAAFYAAYSFTHLTWWYLRFLLPAAPALVIGSLVVLTCGIRPHLSRRAATATVVAALIAVAVFAAHWSRQLGALNSGRDEAVYPRAAAWLNQNLPPNAVLVAMQMSGALAYSTDFAEIRWDWIHPDEFRRYADALATAGRPVYAVLFPFEIQEQQVFTQHLSAGAWTKVADVDHVTVWRWQARWTATDSPRPGAPGQ